MQMIKSFMTDYINSVVSEYFVNITQEQIKPQLSKGQINLFNLQFKPEILKKFALPFIIRESLIKSVSISFVNQYQITIDTLNIVIEILNLNEKFIVESSIKLMILEKFKSTLLENLLKAFAQEKQQQKQQDPKKKLTLNIIQSLELELSNINIKFVDKYCSKSEFGLNLQSLTCKAADQAKTRCINVQGLQIYWQDEVANLTCNAQIQENEIQDQDIMSFSLSVTVQDLDLKCSKQQCNQIYQFADYVHKFQVKQNQAGKMPVSNQKVHQQKEIKEILKKVPLTETATSSLQEEDFKRLGQLLETQSIMELKQIQFEIIQNDKGEEIVQLRKKKLGWFGGMLKFDQKMNEKIVGFLNEMEKDPNVTKQYLSNLQLFMSLKIERSQIILSSIYKQKMNAIEIRFNQIVLNIAKTNLLTIDFTVKKGEIILKYDKVTNYLLMKNEQFENSNNFELHFTDDEQKQSIEILTCPFQIVFDQQNFEQLYDLAYFFVISENHIPKLQKKAQKQIQEIANEKKFKNVSIRLQKFYVISTNGKETFLFCPGSFDFSHDSNNQGIYNIIIENTTLGFSEEIRSAIDFINQQFNFNSIIMAQKFKEITNFDLKVVLTLQQHKAITTISVSFIECFINPNIYKYFYTFYHTHISLPLTELRKQLKQSEAQSQTIIYLKKSDLEQWIQCTYSLKDSFMTCYNEDEKLIKINLDNATYLAKEEKGLQLLEFNSEQQNIIIGFQNEQDRQIIIDKCTRSDDFFVQTLIQQSSSQMIQESIPFVMETVVKLDHFTLSLEDTNFKQFLYIQLEQFLLTQQRSQDSSELSVNFEQIFVGEQELIKNRDQDYFIDIINESKKNLYHQVMIVNQQSQINVNLPYINLAYKAKTTALILQFLTVQHQTNWDIKNVMSNTYQKRYNTYLTMPDIQINIALERVSITLINDVNNKPICFSVLQHFQLHLKQMSQQLLLQTKFQSIQVQGFSSLQQPFQLLNLDNEQPQNGNIIIDYLINDKYQRVPHQMLIEFQLQNVFINYNMQSILQIYEICNFGIYYVMKNPWVMKFNNFKIEGQQNPQIQQVIQQDVKPIVKTKFSLSLINIQVELQPLAIQKQQQLEKIIINCDSLQLFNGSGNIQFSSQLTLNLSNLLVQIKCVGQENKQIISNNRFDIIFGYVINQIRAKQIQFLTNDPLKIVISLSDIKEINMLIEQTIIEQIGQRGEIKQRLLASFKIQKKEQDSVEQIIPFGSKLIFQFSQLQLILTHRQNNQRISRVVTRYVEKPYLYFQLSNIQCEQKYQSGLLEQLILKSTNICSCYFYFENELIHQRQVLGILTSQVFQFNSNNYVYEELKNLKQNEFYFQINLQRRDDLVYHYIKVKAKDIPVTFQSNLFKEINQFLQFQTFEPLIQLIERYTEKVQQQNLGKKLSQLAIKEEPIIKIELQLIDQAILYSQKDLINETFVVAGNFYSEIRSYQQHNIGDTQWDMDFKIGQFSAFFVDDKKVEEGKINIFDNQRTLIYPCVIQMFLVRKALNYISQTPIVDVRYQLVFSFDQLLISLSAKGFCYYYKEIQSHKNQISEFVETNNLFEFATIENFPLISLELKNTDKIKIVFIDDFFSFSQPLFGIKLKDPAIKLEVNEEQHLLGINNELEIQCFNQKKLAWEPVVEPIYLSLFLDINKKAYSFAVKFNFLKPSNINITTSLISNIFRFRQIVKQFMETDIKIQQNSTLLTYNFHEIYNFSGTLVNVQDETGLCFGIQNGEKHTSMSIGLLNFEVIGILATLRIDNWSLKIQKKKVIQDCGQMIIIETILDEYMNSSKTIISSQFIFTNLTSQNITLKFQNQENPIYLTANQDINRSLKTIINTNQYIIPNHLNKAGFTININKISSKQYVINELIKPQKNNTEFINLGNYNFRLKYIPDPNQNERMMIALLPIHEFVNQSPFQIEIKKINEKNQQQSIILLENQTYQDEECNPLKSSKYQFYIERYQISQNYTQEDLSKPLKLTFLEEEWTRTLAKYLKMNLFVRPKIDEYGKHQFIIYINTPFIVNSTELDILIFQGEDKKCDLLSGQKYDTSLSIIPLREFQEKDKIFLGDRNSLHMHNAFAVDGMEKGAIFLNRFINQKNKLIPVTLNEKIRQYDDQPLRLLEINYKYLIINKSLMLTISINNGESIIIKPQQQQPLIIENPNINQNEPQYQCSFSIANSPQIPATPFFDVLRNQQFKIIMRSIDLVQREYLKISIYETKIQQYMIIEEIQNAEEYPYVIINQSKQLFVQLRLDNDVLKHNDKFFVAKNYISDQEFLYPVYLSVNNLNKGIAFDLKLDQVGLSGSVDILNQRFYYLVKQLKNQRQFIFTDQKPLNIAKHIPQQKLTFNLSFNISEKITISYLSNLDKKTKELLILKIDSLIFTFVFNSSCDIIINFKMNGLQIDSQSKQASRHKTIFVSDRETFDESLEFQVNIAYVTLKQICFNLIRIRPGQFQLCIDKKLLSTYESILAHIWYLRRTQKLSCNRIKLQRNMEEYSGKSQVEIVVRKLILEPLKMKVQYFNDTYDFQRQRFESNGIQCSAQKLMQKIISNYIFTGSTYFLLDLMGQFLQNKLLIFNKIKIQQFEKIRQKRALYQSNQIYKIFNQQESKAFQNLKEYLKQTNQIKSCCPFLSSFTIQFLGQTWMLIITEEYFLLYQGVTVQVYNAQEIQLQIIDTEKLLLQVIVCHEVLEFAFTDKKQLEIASSNIERILK